MENKSLFDMTSEEFAILFDDWWDKPSTQTAKKYYDGFKYNTKRKQMYENELKDLELMYLKALGHIKDDLEAVEDVITPYMKRSIALKDQKSLLESKIKALNAKRDKYGEEDGC